MIEHDVRAPAGADTDTPTLLFLHGIGGDCTNWAPQLDRFSDTHRCISWTMPGYGESDPIQPMTWPALADAAAELLDEHRVGRATIVGLSMGGMVAQQFAADHADRLDRLVLVGTSPSFGRPGTDFAAKYLASRYEPLDAGKTPADLAPAVVDGLISPDADPAAKPNCIASMSRITVDAYRRALECLVTWDFGDELHRVAAPTLCIAGAEDRTAPVASLQRLTDGINGATLEVIESAGHLINLEQPERFDAVLSAFIGR